MGRKKKVVEDRVGEEQSEERASEERVGEDRSLERSKERVGEVRTSNSIKNIDIILDKLFSELFNDDHKIKIKSDFEMTHLIDIINDSLPTVSKYKKNRKAHTPEKIFSFKIKDSVKQEFPLYKTVEINKEIKKRWDKLIFPEKELFIKESLEMKMKFYHNFMINKLTISQGKILNPYTGKEINEKNSNAEKIKSEYNQIMKVIENEKTITKELVDKCYKLTFGSGPSSGVGGGVGLSLGGSLDEIEE